MNLLLDTHALIWLMEGDTSLTKKARAAIQNQSNTKFVSVISFYEIAIKLKIGKLKLNKSLTDCFQDTLLHSISVLPVSEQYLSGYNDVPLMPEHGDPFDRLLIATAMVDNLHIITGDKKFDLYKKFVTIIW